LKIERHGSVANSDSASFQSAVGLEAVELCSEVGDYDACQRIGAAAHQLGRAGIVAPAASGLGQTLALLPANLAVEQWSVIIARGIWHGLPADPRWLRAVGQGAG
jgi:hypothetical protein